MYRCPYPKSPGDDDGHDDDEDADIGHDDDEGDDYHHQKTVFH